MIPKKCRAAFVLFIALCMACESNSVKHGASDLPGKDTNQATDTLSDQKTADQLTILKNLLNQKTTPVTPGDYGREVRLDSAISCIRIYRPAMKKHGITDKEELVNIHVPVSSKITEYEEFGGKNLISWMLKTATKFDPQGNGKNLGIRLMLGIYTDDFLNTYLKNNPDLIAKKRNRTTIFLVPFSTITHLPIASDDATAYELGGLEP